MDNIYITIADTIAKRSVAYHHNDFKAANAYNIILMELWQRLPDRTPEPLPEIVFNGQRMKLQYVRGSNYGYASLAVYDPANFAYAPTDRRSRILQELHITEEAIEEIFDLEAAGMNPVDELEEPKPTEPLNVF